ncbi:MAG: peptidyl-prolyl cis-trans isomerase [Blastocatellia bacterium]|nr:peptidyl-prolyl cis-trans isomerase [Blastocatellia bacterium]
MKIMRLFVLLGITLLCVSSARAQEGEAKLIDEVIARVNAGVIMRSSYESALKDVLEELKKRGLKAEELEKQFAEWKVRVLDELISNQLLAQRAKDLSINVDPEVNQQILRLMKENNCESTECLGQKMREAGFDIEDVRKSLTEKFSTERVLGAEVYGRVFRNLTEKEKREFYDKNKDAYSEPGEITLSNIFIALGKDPNQSLLRAKEVVTQARAGVMDFPALAQKYSENEASKKNPSLGAFKIPDLAPEVKAAVENLAVGGVTEPVKLETGYAVFRVDAKKEAKLIPFEDERVQNHVAQMLVQQRSGEQVDEYLSKLRGEAFIELDPRYQFETSKVKSAQIKHTPYSEDSGKKKKKKDKEKEAEKKAAEKTAAKNDNQ